MFLYYQGALKVHPSVVNAAKMFADDGCNVEIFKCFKDDEGVIQSDKIKIIHACMFKSSPLMRIVSLYQFLTNSLSYMRSKKYKALIGIDAYGIVIAGILNIHIKTKLVYHSLEILSSRFNYISLKQKNIIKKVIYKSHHYITKVFERFFNKRAIFTIIQDMNRWGTLREINKLSETSKVIMVPNSPLKNDNGFTINEDYLRNKYHITVDKNIALYAGSLGEWTGIDKVLDGMNNWPDNVFFVVHGRGIPSFIELIRNRINQGHSQKVILSLEILKEDEYNLLVNSSDIGIVWYYDKDDPNVYTIGAGSGKLFYYLKFGLPVIANRWPGLLEIVEGNKCGICVDSEKAIGPAIKMILHNYNLFSDNAKRCFEMYEFSKSYENVIQELRETQYKNKKNVVQ